MELDQTTKDATAKAMPSKMRRGVQELFGNEATALPGEVRHDFLQDLGGGGLDHPGTRVLPMKCHHFKAEKLTSITAYAAFYMKAWHGHEVILNLTTYEMYRS